MTTHKPFREIVSPNSNFEFIGNIRRWVSISAVLIIGSIAMLFVNLAIRGDVLNWSIDFKGGTEVVVAFRDANGKAIDVDADRLRHAPVVHGGADLRAE